METVKERTAAMYVIPRNGPHIWSADEYVLERNGETIAVISDEKTANEIVQACNAYHALVEALTKTLDAWDAFSAQSMASQNLRDALEQARTVLSEASGGTK